MKVLMVLTSNGRLGNTGQKTGLWLEELAVPYYVFKSNDIQVTLASPAGGRPPIDPKSEEPEAQSEASRRFMEDAEARQQFDNTLRLDTIFPEDFDAIFYPGGHGPLWDLAEDDNSISLIESFFMREKPIGCVCHGPAVLLHAKGPGGFPLVKGRRVTGFTNREENWVKLSEVVPFTIEDMLSNRGGIYSKGDAWKSHIEVDGNLVTGQNPASSKAAAEALVELLKR